MHALSVHVCPRCLHHAARQYSLSSRIHSPCRRPKRIQSIFIAHTKGDGYHRAPFLEPAIATALTVVLIAGLAVSGIPQNLIDKAKGSKGGDTPFTDAKSITFGLLDGRIQTCPGAVQPNCVSTSSTNDMYSPAWRANVLDSRAALLDIDSVLLGGKPPATKVLDAETPYGWYVAYSVPGKFEKPDMVEFLVKDEGVTDRGWEGDKPGPLVLYRSIAGDVRYVWPITQPVTDLDTQKKRMQRIRRELGWLLVGCELVECYDEDTDSSAGGNFFTRQLRLFSPQH